MENPMTNSSKTNIVNAFLSRVSSENYDRYYDDIQKDINDGRIFRLGFYSWQNGNDSAFFNELKKMKDQQKDIVSILCSTPLTSCLLGDISHEYRLPILNLLNEENQMTVLLSKILNISNYADLSKSEQVNILKGKSSENVFKLLVSEYYHRPVFNKMSQSMQQNTAIYLNKTDFAELVKVSGVDMQKNKGFFGEKVVVKRKSPAELAAQIEGHVHT